MSVKRSTLNLRDDSRQAIHADPAGLQPLGYNVLVEVLEEEWVSPSGLYLPDNVQPKSCQGLVIGIGNDAPAFDELDVQIGDHVVFEEVQEESWVYDGREYVLVPYQTILGVVASGV